MKPSKSVNSLLANGGQQQQQQQQQQLHHSYQLGAKINNNDNARRHQPLEPQRAANSQQVNNASQNGNSAPTSPICRCRVMYLGSSVPHITKDGLQGIQEPLRDLYPDGASLSSGNAGIDSWLSVWSNGILVENVDENGREVKRFFKIEALHYCAAVKYIAEPGDQQQQQQAGSSKTLPTGVSLLRTNLPKFLPLDSPHARLQQSNENPPIFASILRRTTGVKVLECHAFICKREAAANALVRCCFHAYADTMYAKQIGADIESISATNKCTDQSRAVSMKAQTLKRVSDLNNNNNNNNHQALNSARRSKSIAALNEDALHGDQSDSSQGNSKKSSLYQESSYSSAVMRRKSLTENNNNNEMNGGDMSDSSHQQQQQAVAASSKNLRKQYHLSKSMHQLNQASDQQHHLAYHGVNDFASQMGSHSTSIHNLASSKARWNLALEEQGGQQSGQPSFYNPHASRVPSYPPQSMLDQQQKQLNNGGTLRSIRSVAANSIASTLLRSKKHAKAMSAAQMNLQQQQQQQQQEINRLPPGFHQPHLNGSATLAPSQSFMMPPVPPMFLPRLPIFTGSQTLKLPKQQMLAPFGPFGNFETMTPKEMKKLLKKSAKYGLDPSEFGSGAYGENGQQQIIQPFRAVQAAPPMQCNIQAGSLQSNKSGTINSQSIYSMVQQQQQQHLGGLDMADLAASLPPPPQLHLGSPFHHPDHQDSMDPNFAPAPIKSILVKPNPEFLKSKAGKKWLKQQKEFKKLLPPHLDGLPIVFGPPPMDALEPAIGAGCDASAVANGLAPPPAFLHPTPPVSHSHLAQPPPPLPGLPMMDSNGYYSQLGQPMYHMLPSGRASTASTLLRYSPHSMQQQILQMESLGDLHYHHHSHQQHQRGHSIYGQPPGPPPPPPPPPPPNHRDSFSAMMNGGGDHHVNGQMYGSQLGATLDNRSRQYVFGSTDPMAPHHRRRRKHMVEQSVISLGDENEGDEGDEEDHARVTNGNGDHHAVCQEEEEEDREDDNGHINNGYYNRVKESSLSQQQQQLYRDDQQNYEQVMPPETLAQQQNLSNDDQSSYSSGIYRRGHINERAFSYSIRQENKSGGTKTNTVDGGDYVHSDGDYRNQVNYSNQVDHHHQQASMYESPLHNQQMVYHSEHGSGPQYRVVNNNNDRLQADELSARMENQLNMRSFANSSRVRSHM